MIWEMRHPRASIDMLGLIPTFLSEADPRPAREQLDANYRHGGGWIPHPGFAMLPGGALAYPGDPDLPLLAEARLRGEVVRFYECSWVAVVAPDGSFEVARMD